MSSNQLKEEGNRHFKSGDYVSAEALYSKAIIADSNNPSLYTNRAMARLKMGLWDNIISDCTDCLRLSPNNMKANYYMSIAHLALHNYDEALQFALKAHELCTKTLDKSLPSVTAQVLKCKKERWEDKEKRRTREGAELEADMITLLYEDRDHILTGLRDPGVRKEIESECERKTETLRWVFNKARSAEDRRREVPDWAVDDISFGVMVDPVVTKMGKSYERASILEHLRRSQTDPLTREPLSANDLRPNLALKQACEEFLEENGWAVDW